MVVRLFRRQPRPHRDAERYVYDKAGNMVKKKILRAGRAGAPRTPQSEDYIWDGLALTAFGERLDNEDDSSSAIRSLGEGWFTGKPHVADLGHAFLFRNYRATLAKWQTADPMGYPDGWNQLAYCENMIFSSVDFLGTYSVGDITPMRGNDGIADVIMNGTANGGTVHYSLAGFVGLSIPSKEVFRFLQIMLIMENVQ